MHIRAIGGQSARTARDLRVQEQHPQELPFPPGHLREVAETAGGQRFQPGRSGCGQARCGLIAQVVHQLRNWGLTRSARGLGLGRGRPWSASWNIAAFVVPGAAQPPARQTVGEAPARRPCFQARVVVGADHGELRHLLTAKPGTRPRVPGAVQADGAGRDRRVGPSEGASSLGLLMRLLMVRSFPGRVTDRTDSFLGKIFLGKLLTWLDCRVLAS